MGLDVPSGYALERERGADVVALPSVIDAVRDRVRGAGTLYGWASAQPGARALAGRGAAYVVDGADGEWVVRHYRRGGAVARLLNDRYLRLGEVRPLRELRASEAARARGVSTPQIVAAVIYAEGPVYRADLATRLVPGAADLADTVLGSGDRAAGGAGARIAAWTAAGRLLRSAFAAGVEHADLNMRNILIQRRGDAAAACDAWLLDLDRAVVGAGAVSAAARSAMLERLHRSRRKLEHQLHVTTGAAELAAFDSSVNGDA
jgi:3-deoxy-D-manno-octulosonic acid kinase